jgi:sulfite exporter TauE/SafE/copper chaperone CopZ
MSEGQDDAGRRHDTHLTVLQLDVRGMHCANCAVSIERRFKQLPQVNSASVDYPTGRAEISHTGVLDIASLQQAIGDDGYTVAIADGIEPARSGDTVFDYIEMGAAFIAVLGAVLLLQHANLIPRGLSVSDTASYGLVFVIGLVASVSSCLAVTGGLLVAFAAKYSAANPHLTDRERLLPHLYFNAGRLVSYAVLGGAVGALGSALMLSPTASGIVAILASVLMIVLGLQMLGLFPSLARLTPALPKSLTHRIHDLAAGDTRRTAFLLGGLTFFLPCGFTQALQLYVLAAGDFLTGALTMLAFALGTLPALSSLSALSSLAKGAFQNRFLKLAGAAVILLGVMNLQSGLVLTGSDMGPTTAPTTAKQTSEPTGQQTAAAEPQRISMKVVGLDYVPNQFTVKEGVPVEWWIDASEAEGCGRFLMAPRLRIRKLLSGTGTTLVTFTPDRPGEYAFNCGMGMMTPDSKITVLPRGKG